ncbi:hypothetical protein MIND_00045000 [Mycena indigotica]|uniref:DUF7082 domain-containing protein n=1 Tax=Mycena indigotica TaxID=2126181 RepID=A0A8H6TAQ2_9AGAR|nr:uncharacterized protein MIND_00045000 [Mycena indigotica]KAF7315305.1 hypothetical protein MIND_00045000 [Mycena indigotica]
MNTNAKYSALPDIDTAQDVYETEDSLPTVNAIDHGSDDEALPTRSTFKTARVNDSSASKEELDSSNLIQHDEASKRFKKAEKRRERANYVYPPSPTSPDEPSPSRPVPLSQRLRALQAEILSLEKELAEPANPLLFKERDDDVVNPGELIRGLVDVRGRLDKIRKGKEGRGRLVGVILGQDIEKEVERLDGAVPSTDNEKPAVRTIVEMDRRVGELEKLVGSSTATIDESSPLPPPLLPLITRLNGQLTLLTQPRHIDSVSRRLKLLLSDLDRASASQHSHRRHPSQSNNSAPSQIQEQILPLLSRLNPSLPHIPHILARLRTLSALHTSASEFENTLQALEEDHRKMREALSELEGAVGTIEKSMEANREVVKDDIMSRVKMPLDEQHLEQLDQIQARLQALRNAPATVLKTSLAFSTSSTRQEFLKLKELTELVSSDTVQELLATVAKSEREDSSDLSHDPRRSIQKRRRPPSVVGSPQPYVGVVDKQIRPPFPPESNGLRPLREDELAEYIREYNRTHSRKLHIWTRTKGLPFVNFALEKRVDNGTDAPRPNNLAIIRFTISDVLVCYITTSFDSSDPVLVAESITVFGPREKKSPYSHSDFLVYQSLSQHFASLLQAHPFTSFQNIVALLEAYDGLFLTPCGKCGRVLSVEGHEPPVIREEGAPITVRIHFVADNDDPIHVRLVLANKAVNTAVRELEGFDYGRWQLDAAAPPITQLSIEGSKAPITVQALNAQDDILDSVFVGDFVYWDVKPQIQQLGRPRAATHNPTASPHYSLPSPSLSDRFPRSKVRSRRSYVPKSAQDLSLVRTGHYPTSVDSDDNLFAHAPLLEIVTPLDSLCSGWKQSEVAAGRRLVRFQKSQLGRRVILSGEAIRQEDYRDTDTVISCIFREEVGACYVTSVDIIYLLERLTNDQFPVEEKNRIRRNLEGLRPTTVSKHKRGSEAFFQRIMDFPDPKPRNIEKDLKVFEWCLLGQALEKIMSKYSIYTSSPTDSTSSLPAESGPSFSQDSPLTIDPTLDDKTPLRGLLLHFDGDQYSYPVKQESDSSSGSNFSDTFPTLHDRDTSFDVPEFDEAQQYEPYLGEDEMHMMF